jgi:hypothetical protein
LYTYETTECEEERPETRRKKNNGYVENSRIHVDRFFTRARKLDSIRVTTWTVIGLIKMNFMLAVFV